MSSQPLVFKKDDLNFYLNELSKEYKRLGGRKVPIDIILIGGAAILINYGFREMTTDVDAIYPAVSILKEAANRISDRYDLPVGWLNSDFVKTQSYSEKLYLYSTHYQTFNQVLDVRTVTGEYMIAMKLRAGRKYKNDLSDIVGILAEHNRAGDPISFSMIEEAVNNLYGGWNGFPEDSITFIHTILSLEDYDAVYSSIQEGERLARETLIKLQISSPSVVHRGNIDEIIESSQKEQSGKGSVLALLEEREAQENREDGG